MRQTLNKLPEKGYLWWQSKQAIITFSQRISVSFEPEFKAIKVKKILNETNFNITIVMCQKSLRLKWTRSTFLYNSSSFFFLESNVCLINWLNQSVYSFDSILSLKCKE